LLSGHELLEKFCNCLCHKYNFFLKHIIPFLALQIRKLHPLKKFVLWFAC
jgi:hypothetical protein